MPQLIWSQPALLDVQRLYRSLATKNVGAVKGVREEMEIIARQPEVGRPVNGMEPEYRE